MNCPVCRQPNQSDAPFCVECGDSLALGNAAVGGAAGGGAPASIAHQLIPLPDMPDETFAPAFTLRHHRFGISLALAGLLIAMLLNSMAQSSEAQATRYRQGLAAAQQQQWHRALTLLSPLADQDYDQASALYRKAANEAATWDRYHQLAASAEGSGATSQAAFYYNRASQIEPGYGDPATRLSALRSHLGQVIYLSADGLYLAPADGEPGTQLPGSGSAFDVLATSPDGNLVCYVFNSGYGTVHTRNLVVGDIANQFYAEQSFIFDQPVPSQPLDAAFVNNGQGLLFVVGGKIGAPASGPLQLYYFDLVGSTGLREIGIASLVAHPNPGSTTIYFVPAANTTAISVYDTRIERAARVGLTEGAIVSLAVSPAFANQNATYNVNLFYALTNGSDVQLYSLPQPSGNARLLLTEPVAAPLPVVQISPSSLTASAVATIVGSRKVWLLEGDGASLISEKWTKTIGAVADVQYSPDGSRILVVGQSPRDFPRAPYGILDSQGKLLNSSYYDAPASQIGWLYDSRHFYLYAHDSNPAPAPDSDICQVSAQSCSRDHVAVLNCDGGMTYIFTLGSAQAREPTSLFSLLPDSKTLIYAAPYGANLSALAEQLATPTLPTTAIPNATGVWVLR